MIKDMQIRAAHVADIPAIEAVLERCGLPINDVTLQVAQFHVAVVEGRVVGCACAERFGDTAMIRSVAVLHECRDQGIATHLVRAAMMRARANGSRRAVLLTSSCPDYFARYGFSLVQAAQLPVEVRDSEAFRRQSSSSALCMCAQLD
ncbi:GNAT family N-acetyltransferase [Cupriavidus pampae]|uniref:Amino-acid acetyltransferase n=1 Tax=Cupriavidus pampae TaxID=659251 RepID=A0ABN7YAM9_9BURK|nr:GNAT family N-acetyltransferase [Cupriavidus pampae]CAG9170432.1 Amino-acid acetyltransferase [Cupriavidus pampae]